MQNAADEYIHRRRAEQKIEIAPELNRLDKGAMLGMNSRLSERDVIKTYQQQ